MNNYLFEILTKYRNKVLDAEGAEGDIYRLMAQGKVDEVVRMARDNSTTVDNAIKEYNPQTHDVMNRRNKPRVGDVPYITEKLPRSWQRYINEVELFFLLGKPVVWNKKDGDDDAYKLFLDFLEEQSFNTGMRQCKRLAGAETESAKLYHIYNDGGIRVKTVVLARSTGYNIRPLFDQYGSLQAFCYGYKLREKGKVVAHWDIETPRFLYFCAQGGDGWGVRTYPNPTGKINVIYYTQPKAWDGVEQRIKREEMLDSRIGDTNNYFADPIAKASADVIDGLSDPDRPGKLIQLLGKESQFDYVEPPQGSQTRDAEKQDLHDSILFDSMTPDFSFDKIKGMGTLSGAAIKNSFILGYIKRERNVEIYGEMLRREKNVIIEILKYIHPDKAGALDGLKIGWTFAEPFDTDTASQWSTIASLYTQGVLSLEEAVEQLAICDHPDAEIERLKTAKKEEVEAQNTTNKENLG